MVEVPQDILDRIEKIGVAMNAMTEEERKDKNHAFPLKQCWLVAPRSLRFYHKFRSAALPLLEAAERNCFKGNA